MKNKVNTFILSLLVFAFSFFLILPGIPFSLATNETHEISTFEELVNCASLSRTKGSNDDTYILMNDIVITEENQKTLESSGFKYISFGSSDYPFSGVFDGNNHTISNLKYDANLSVKSDTGLFSETNGAVIKNLIIDNASIDADYRGGIVVGYSNNTLFENILVKNSRLSVSASNNVVSLITDGGIRAATVVGESVNSILYNCESKNNTVNTNNTVGVSALSGKGLTLGALVGVSDNSLVEYSRVYGGLVKNYYDVAVGALGGNTLYVGGIVGRMKNSSMVIDSFSTAELYFYCATYVSVGAGNSGHIGGITAAMEGNSNEIIRSHYAGAASSRQYNAVLVIPIIQNNVNISGIADVFDGGSVVNSYFKPSMSSDVDMNVLGNNSSTSSYGPVNDEKYANIDFWQGSFYDVTGTIKRNTLYNDSHYNKWVIDNALGIPVHGKSVAATLNFNNAGKVTIDKTKLIASEVSTSNPYSFARQGLEPNEYNINLSAKVNDGYKFIGWYKVPNVTATTLDNSDDFFHEVFNKYEVVSDFINYDNAPCDNNNLFVARYKVGVIFHDINGDIINNDGNVDNDMETIWYDYNDKFPEIIPVNKPNSDTASLIGWTTKVGGYSAISVSDLNTIKLNGSFYELDDKVTSSLSLYPVYADLISNINTIFEGNELDNSDNTSLRENVGYTSSYIDDEEKIVISVSGYGDNDKFPEGYRFLGWYDESGNKISKNKTYVLDEVDITLKHSFIARFEYKVDYYGSTTKFYDSSDFDGNPFEKPFASIWHTYEQILTNIGDSVVFEEGDEFDGWYLGIPNIPHKSGEYEDCLDELSSKKITEPITVHAHVSGDSSSYEIYLTSDFPGAGKISTDNLPSGLFYTVSMTDIKDGYNFLFWASGRNNGNRQETSTSPTDFDSGGIFYTGADYGYEAHLDANVVFHNKSSEIITTVTRRYQEKVFSATDIKYQYTWPIEQSNIDDVTNKSVDNGIHISKAYPYNLKDTNLTTYGYSFIGWVDKNSLTASEWDYIYSTNGQSYSVAEDAYVSSTIQKASPYLLDEDDICVKPMDIYPVYVKYEVITKINVTHGELSSDINLPDNPTYTIEELDDTGYANVIMTPDLDTYVVGDSGEKYVLTSYKIIYNDGTSSDITSNNDGTYTYKIKAGATYTFIANYEPLVLVYHLDDSNIQTIIKTTGQEVGDMPKPTYDLSTISNRYLFAGYSKQKPTFGYHMFDSYESYNNSGVSLITSSMLVSNSMELWPVFISSSITINSNIDTYLENNSYDIEQVRTFNKEDIDKFKIIVSKTQINNYHFIGWYKNYKSNEEVGELITTNTEYVLTHTDSMSNDTFTAVYKKIYELNYYGKDNSLLYTSYVSEDDDRTFVKKVIDNEGNAVLTMVDFEAFETISNTLLLNEAFNKFNWVKEDGTVIKWEEFNSSKITSNMNLYPVITKTTAFDHNGNEMDVIGTNDKQPDVLIGYKKDSIVSYLNTLYKYSNITIHVEEVSNIKTSNQTKFIDKLEVTIHSTTSLDTANVYTNNTDEDGNVSFTLEGVLKIKKNKLSNSKINDIFIFNIYKKDDLINPILTVGIKQEEEKLVKLLYGEYVIIEDEKWAWRYTQTSTGNLIVCNYFDAEVAFDNVLKNNKWFDEMTNKTNIFN